MRLYISQHVNREKFNYVDRGVESNYAVLNDLLKFFLRDTKRRVDVVKGIRKVAPVYSKVFNVIRNACHRSHFDMAIERETSRALDQSSVLCPRKILGCRS